MKELNPHHCMSRDHVPAPGKGWLTLMAILLVAGMVTGCGVKRAPVPPEQPRPPAVSDLAFSIENGWVLLSWHMPKAALDWESPEIVGFDIYRSKTSLKDTCNGCPLMFQFVDSVVPYTTTKSAHRDTVIGYADKLEKGYRYVYKVVGVTENNITSGDSNPVEFNYGEK